jgi:hypothetical protein
MRWRWPPLNSCGYLSRSAGAQAHGVQRLGGALRCSARARRAARPAVRPRLQHGAARVQRAVRVLEHHLEVAARARRSAAASSVCRSCPSTAPAGGGRFQRHHQPRQRALARARFTHHAQAAPALQREAHAVQRLHRGPGAEQGLARQPVLLVQGRSAVQSCAVMPRPSGCSAPRARGSPCTGGGARRQSSTTSGQRSAKGQPAGMSTSSGTRPGWWPAVCHAPAQARPGREQARV